MHKVRHLTDGMATTSRVDGLKLVSSYPDGELGFQVLTSWAGDPAPKFRGITATRKPNGAVVVWGLGENETPQFREGIARRVRNYVDTTRTTDTEEN